MESLPILKKQLLILFCFSVFASIAAIIHGVFFDLDFNEIKRLTWEGLVLTFLVIYPAILFLEWVFDINNKKKFDDIERKLKKLR